MKGFKVKTGAFNRLNEVNVLPKTKISSTIKKYSCLLKFKITRVNIGFWARGLKKKALDLVIRFKAVNVALCFRFRIKSSLKK